MRKIIPLNDGWKFIAQNVGLPDVFPADWQDVTLPHCWNAVDGMDGNGSYDRGSYWYAKTFTAPSFPLPRERVFVEFPAAGQTAVVYVNGKEVARHEGGYSCFRADITDACRAGGDNLLVVNCANEACHVYPQSADFTFYGGLYRGVNLILVPAAHFALEYFGTPGIRVTPRPGKFGNADFAVETWTVNTDDSFTVLYTIRDADGAEVAGGSRPADDTAIRLCVPDARLWSVDAPYLYTVEALLVCHNEVYDAVSVRCGVRSFDVRPDKGFILNGVPMPLRGVARHQDRLYQGNALSAQDHREDAALIKELGANTIRLAHYQHSQDFYDACDELGFVLWAEIPFISVFMTDSRAHANCVSQLTELIIQNYHHPSIFFWGISNEILIGGISQQLVDNHHALNQLAKQLDPTRMTTIAHVSSTPTSGPMHRITDVESYNHYFGWYGGKIADNAAWLDKFHEENPDICLGISEYGCEGIISRHSAAPQCKDYTEEYQALYHEGLARIIDERPWLWATHVWNMFDFGCAARSEGGVAGRNNKGLVTIDRKIRKDSFYLYQAYWTTKPMVHIAGRRYAKRAGDTTKIKVYSNQDTVSLYVNDALAGVRTGRRVFEFEVSLAEGQNVILAVAGPAGVKEAITLEKVEQEPACYVLPEFNERQEGVANWFKMMGSMDLNAPMEFPEGYYSIRDSIEEIAKNEEALAIAAKAVKLATNVDVVPGEGMWDLIRTMTLDSVDSITGMADGFVESLNAQLTKIKK